MKIPLARQIEEVERELALRAEVYPRLVAKGTGLIPGQFTVTSQLSVTISLAAIPILFAYRQPPQLKGIVDGTLIFGMPLSAAMMQAALTRGMDDNILAWSAFIASAIYFTLARLLWNRRNMRLLAEAHLESRGVV